MRLVEQGALGWAELEALVVEQVRAGEQVPLAQSGSDEHSLFISTSNYNRSVDTELFNTIWILKSINCIIMKFIIWSYLNNLAS